MYKDVCKKLHDRRIKLGIPASVVCRKMHISRQALSNKETGISELTTSQFVEYCEALGIKKEEAISLLFF